MGAQSKMKAFSLIEVLIALMIIVILMSIIYPSYTHYIMRVRRHQAEVILLSIINHLQVYHGMRRTYLGATLSTLSLSKASIENYYEINLVILNADQFKLSAIPKGRQKQDICGMLSVNALGERFSSAEDAMCW